MSNVFEYITIDNERWDQIAYKAYGVITLVDDTGVNIPAMQPIIQANPTVPIYDKLPGGIILQIPVLDTNTAKTATELLPPWKR
jgi:hypothetical protein